MRPIRCMYSTNVCELLDGKTMITFSELPLLYYSQTLGDHTKLNFGVHATISLLLIRQHIIEQTGMSRGIYVYTVVQTFWMRCKT